MIRHSKDIKQAVADAFNITVGDLDGPCRKRKLSVPRQVACQFMHDHTTLSLPQIGRTIGRDHTTVLHALSRFQDHAAHPEYGPTINRAREALLGGVFSSVRAGKGLAFCRDRA